MFFFINVLILLKLIIANMDKWLIPARITNYIHYKVWDEIFSSIPKLQRLHRWSLGMDK